MPIDSASRNRKPGLISRWLGLSSPCVVRSLWGDHAWIIVLAVLAMCVLLGAHLLTLAPP